jgi:DeoR/GlpR family transcriptional regulator of sugar metabolism
MLAAQRRSIILSELDRDGTVKVSDLVARMGVSDMTVRRDLQALHRQGLLQKVHGGAMAVAEPSTAEPGFEANSARRQPEKEVIAMQAASLVRPGSAIAVSAGTTTHAFARHILDIPDLTVVTNSVWVADILHRSGRDSSSVLVTGGLRTPSDALVGPVAISALSSLHVDAVFLGVHGMEEEGAGFSTPNLLEAETNRAMIRSGRRLVVLADSSKWGVVGLSSMARLSDAHVLITDTGLSAQASAILAERVEQLVLVDPPRPRRWGERGVPALRLGPDGHSRHRLCQGPLPRELPSGRERRAFGRLRRNARPGCRDRRHGASAGAGLRPRAADAPSQLVPHATAPRRQRCALSTGCVARVEPRGLR